MAEHVCDMTDDYPDVPYGSDEYSGTVERREEVVRCRDCAHAIRLEGETAEARPGMLNCVYFAQWDYYDDEQGVWLVEPDGFCAWASRREDGQCRTLR